MDEHARWVQQIDAELDGELTLAERAALARHLATCGRCAGARASHLEMRAAMASAAGEPQAQVVPRPTIRGSALLAAVAAALFAGVAAGWLGHQRFGGPGGHLEGVRAAVVVQ